MTIPIDRRRAILVALLPLAAFALGLAIITDPDGTDLLGIELPEPVAVALGTLMTVIGVLAAGQLIWHSIRPNPGLAILQDEVIVRAGVGRTRTIRRTDIESVSIGRSRPKVIAIRLAGSPTISIPTFLLDLPPDLDVEQLAASIAR